MVRYLMLIISCALSYLLSSIINHPAINHTINAVLTIILIVAIVRIVNIINDRKQICKNTNIAD